MIYLLDFVFFSGYLAIGDIDTWMLKNKYAIYMKIRKWYYWFEASYILFYVCYIPNHSQSESLVTFSLCLCTKYLHDLIFKNLKQ